MSESQADKKTRVLEIINVFDMEYSDADCTLEYKNVLELLISTQLAAQCTDARVNIVTRDLYKKYKNVYDFANADEAELQNDIRATGFFRNKAKNIIACCRMLIEKYGGEVPPEMDELLKLPGVGRKTANLIRGDYFKIPGIVVDTHATRISGRLGLTKNKEPYKIELDLLKIVPEEYRTKFCHQLVYHGRKYCTARSPKCDACPIGYLCPAMNENL